MSPEIRTFLRPFTSVCAALALLYLTRFALGFWITGHAAGAAGSLPQGLLLVALSYMLFKGQIRWLASIAVLAPLAVMFTLVSLLLAPIHPVGLVLSGCIIFLWVVLGVMVWRQPARRMWFGR